MLHTLFAALKTLVLGPMGGCLAAGLATWIALLLRVAPPPAVWIGIAVGYVAYAILFVRAARRGFRDEE